MNHRALAVTLASPIISYHTGCNYIIHDDQRKQVLIGPGNFPPKINEDLPCYCYPDVEHA